MGNFAGFGIMIVLFGIMYFLIIRPQKKQQQKHAETLKQLQKGDHVVTIGRLHGVVDEIDTENKTVTLDCDGIYLVFDMSAVAKVTNRVSETVQNDKDSSEDKTEEKPSTKED
ncbi:preprotein translocase subunit YajC [Apilactobacillus apisilvae]|uniref:Preprotein translocase subunit YajC n=1 Tax=Apilactobacillus apisilvae TaxID=2923364 RepID=A0ABY4PHV0_9LACO|nr:preprotein translocase subunit YajC [Apilactobacillus apisilvae]UQS85193.1 preprotein translocase subunit YajC [Apilactobacillus apisilvae]